MWQRGHFCTARWRLILLGGIQTPQDASGQYHRFETETAYSCAFALYRSLIAGVSGARTAFSGIAVRQHFGGNRLSTRMAVSTSWRKHIVQYLCWHERETICLVGVFSKQLQHSLEDYQKY